MEEVKREKKSLKGYWGTTFLIGLGFFTMGLMDPLYDNYVPIFLGYYLEQNSLIGLVMTLDNILAIFLIPIFSALSDRTHTPIGRRMPLMDVKITLPGLGTVDKVLAFPVASLFVIVAVILLFIFVKESRSRVSSSEERAEKNDEPILRSLKAVIGEKEKSALYILLSLLCWFIAYQGILPFVGLYTTDVLGTSAGTAALSSGMVGVAYAIFAVPSGKFAHKHGRKKTIRGALFAIVVVLFLVFIHSAFLSGLPYMVRLISFWALLFLFGIFWVTVITNSFPMLWQMADYKTMGIYTGLYYFFSQAASIISPPLAGGATDLWGYPALFLYGLFFMLIAFFLMRKVERGEPEDD